VRKLLPTVNGRTDLSAIVEWIEEGSSVLDLGCGDGALLDYLVNQ
jgi:cyclopropane fatty-acyl-phospholipid synthase-like methyltransferase